MKKHYDDYLRKVREGRSNDQSFDEYITSRKVRDEKPRNIKRRPYFAYGSNLNVAGMKRRCPDAVKGRSLIAHNGVLVFRGVADVIASPGDNVYGGLWWISPEDEAKLDGYEGVNHEYPKAGMYVKRYFHASGIKQPVLFYQMNSKGIMPPSEYYLNVIRVGYRDFNLPLEALETAVQNAWTYKRPTPFLKARHKQRGGNLAKPRQFKLINGGKSKSAETPAS